MDKNMELDIWTWTQTWTYSKNMSMSMSLAMFMFMCEFSHDNFNDQHSPFIFHRSSCAQHFNFQGLFFASPKDSPQGMTSSGDFSLLTDQIDQSFFFIYSYLPSWYKSCSFARYTAIQQICYYIRQYKHLGTCYKPYQWLLECSLSP